LTPRKLKIFVGFVFGVSEICQIFDLTPQKSLIFIGFDFLQPPKNFLFFGGYQTLRVWYVESFAFNSSKIHSEFW